MIFASGAVVIRGPEPLLRAVRESLGAIIETWSLRETLDTTLWLVKGGHYLVIGSPDAVLDELTALQHREGPS